MELTRRAEQLTVTIRWAVLAAAAFMLYGRVEPAFLGAIVGLVAAYNTANWLGARTLESYEKWGHMAGSVARVLTMALMSMVMLNRAVFDSSLYMLYVVALVQVAFVHQRRQPVFIAAATAFITIAAATWIHHPGQFSTIGLGRMGVIIVGGFVAFYIAAYKRQDDVSHMLDERLAALFDCSMQATSGDDLARVLTHTVRTAIRATNARCGFVQLASETEPNAFETEVAASSEGSFEFPDVTHAGEGSVGYVAATGQPLLLNSDTGNAGWKDPIIKNARAAICVPLLDRSGQYDPSSDKQQEVVGLLTLLSDRAGQRFTEEDLNLARTFAAMASMAAVNARMYAGMKRTFLSTLETLAKSLEARDEYTRGHSQRVCEVSLLIARDMGLREDVIEEMRVGTLLHDIGKIGIRDAVLNKPGRLTAEEFEQMKQHSVIGWEICRPLGLSDGALMLIRNHHERLDGSGYPDGLKAGDLPLSLRIVCAADAFDAMSSRRPYREVMDEKLRVEQLNRFAGSQFDPVVVQILKTLLVERKLDEIYRDHWFKDEPQVELEVVEPSQSVGERKAA